MDAVNLNKLSRRLLGGGLAAASTAALVALSALVVSCGDSNNATNNNTDKNNPPIKRDPPKPGETWKLSTIDEDGGGLHIQLAASKDGKLGVVYFPVTGVEDGLCEELGFDSPPPRVRWSLTYAELNGSTWEKSVVGDFLYVGQPTGVDLGYYANGNPVIATMTGAPLPLQKYCGVNDMGLMTRQGAMWQTETAVTSSGDAATGEPGSDFGEVVGYFPSLAFDSSGQPAIAYKDVHSGSIQSDDRRRADLELAWRQGNSWRAIPVDFGQGAGNYNQLRFDAQNRPTIAYYMPTESLEQNRQGIWVTRSEDDGATWPRVQLYNQSTSERPSMAIDNDGKPHVVFYHANKGYPSLASLEDAAEFESSSKGWKLQDIGDSRFDEGYSPSMAIGPDGQLAVAYYRCTKSTGTLGDCTTEDDALIFAFEDNGEWTREVVDEGDVGGYCGSKPSLTFDADGYAVIAYRCEVEANGTLQSQIKLARRKSLP